MYDQFYGLQGRPFQLTPDPHFYFESATHRKALSYLGYGLAQGEGFIVITGDIGAGKTTLVGHLMNTVDAARLTAVKIVSTQVEGDDMLRLAAQSFGLAVDGMPKAQILRQIEGYLHTQARAGKRTLLIVDEAQNLPISAIEELRMLSNFQLGGQSLLQIFLLGQPEFRELVKSPELEQLRQRVIATHHLDPMMRREVEPYILHRLSLVGWNGEPQFTAEAFNAIYAATGGVPRRINVLTSRVLLLGALDQLSVIDADAVYAVVADMGADADVTPQPMAHSVLDEAEELVELVAAPQPVAADPALSGEVTALRAEIDAMRKARPEPAAGLREEIASLRAEIETLRAEQDFARVVPSVDPEAVKDCFALVEERLSTLEFRVTEQDTALRRVLTLLVEWVEREERMSDAPHSAAA
ncbi:XrtA/PEP-CTERM system-associated ATPase [Sphingobium bisphenolivorans]|uniref:XrtA/PEP-CTERM system-associated ATPase n=1 Tax=Sphingobium bisphenolivorans TaxID=1335760 RepID=UPI00039D2077|nr:XrtA/PEP-CTERM system-associated ATPase [Sphingobium bisphenolivorans]